MKVVDTIYINDGGGYIMLEFFISQAKARSLSFFYLIDVRLKSKIESLGLKSDEYLIVEDSEIARLIFYRSNKSKITSLLTFGNVPPPLRMNCCVYTIFHNMLLLNNDHLPFLRRMKYFMKSLYIRLLSKNTDHWIIQSEETQKELLKKNWDDPKKIIIAPFWKSELNNLSDFQPRQNLTFLYPCSTTMHKNLFRLIKAWENAFRKNHGIKLCLTLPNSWFTENKIEFENINIIPLGTLSYPDLVSWYRQSEFVIFPSYCESFGLPLIEGIENGCKIIASDLPYTHSIIEPYLVFNPFDSESIMDTILLAASKKNPITSGNNIIKIDNKINQILSSI